MYMTPIGEKKVLQKASVCSCEHMCPGLCADMQQCAVSVFEREGKRQIKEREIERKGVVLTKREGTGG